MNRLSPFYHQRASVHTFGCALKNNDDQIGANAATSRWKFHCFIRSQKTSINILPPPSLSLSLDTPPSLPPSPLLLPKRSQHKPQTHTHQTKFAKHSCLNNSFAKTTTAFDTSDETVMRFNCKMSLLWSPSAGRFAFADNATRYFTSCTFEVGACTSSIQLPHS